MNRSDKNIILQAISFTSLVLFFLGGIILLNIDLKRTYYAKLELITSCEKTAKEGAFYIFDGSINSINTSKPNDLAITVSLDKKINLISGSILGLDKQKITTSATAYHLPMEKVWQFETDAHIHCPPAIYDGILYCGTLAGVMFAFDPKTGRKLWEFDTNCKEGDCSIQSKPMVVNDSVCFTVVNAQNNPDRFTYLYALDAKTGLLKWDTPTLISQGYGREDYIWHNSSPAIFKDTCYVGSVDGKFYAIDINTGKIIDSYTTYGSIISSPLISDGVIYFGSNDGKLRALTITKSGKLEFKWAYPYTSSLGKIRCRPTIFDNKIYFTAGKSCIYALDVESGDLCWVYDTSNIVSNFDILSSPIIEITSSGEKLIHLGNGGGVAICLKEKNGVDLKWIRNLGMRIETNPVILNGIIYYGVKSGHNKGCLVALRSSDGVILQKYYIKNNIRSSPIIYNDILYFGGCDSNIYALRTINPALPLVYLVK